MDILSTVTSNIPISQPVQYQCTMTNTWSGANHPIEYPSGIANWSPPVLVAHSKPAHLFCPGEFASPGIENVAELGNPDVLLEEVEVLQTRGLAGEAVVGRQTFNNVDPPQVFEPITLCPMHPYLSTVTMMGPSPDWFSGIHSFTPRGPGNYWFQSFELATYPLDAGTEQGDTYSVDNPEADPHEPIYQLTRDTVPDSGILLDQTGTTVLPVITWSCEIKKCDSMAPVGGGLRNTPNF